MIKKIISGGQTGADIAGIVASNKEPFLILIDATAYEAGIEKPVKHKTLFVNKNHIIWAVPEESQN